MGRIRLLSEHLANQIAAGEVVERPASVVKELVENAVDAGATEILIELEEGGISYIRVLDNGSGIEAADVAIAFERHATSKLKRERDLFQIRTLGFRGEALPSIASVAKVELVSATDEGKLGTKIVVEGGTQKELTEVPHAKGTEVIVRDLFYNTPARLKYLKTVNTEISHVADYVGRMALAHPEVSFTLRHEKRELFHSMGDGKLLHAILALYGKQVASKMVSFEAADADFRISGYAAKPEVTRSNRSYLTFLLNGRYLRSMPIQQTILEAYGTLLTIGRYPIVVLQVEMDPKLCDVNVHPAKLEVRLSKERELCQLIKQAIEKALGSRRLIPEFSPGKEKQKNIQGSLSFARSTVSRPVVKEEKAKWRSKERTAPLPFSTEKNNNQFVSQITQKNPPEKSAAENEEKEFLSATKSRGDQLPAKEDRSQEKKFPSASLSVDETQSFQVEEDAGRKKRATAEASPLEAADKKTKKKDDTIEEEQSFSEEEPTQRLPRLQPLAQIHGTYIVAQAEDGFYLLDQHAAHERIYYELFLKKLAEENQPQQPLLLPIQIECSPSETQLIHSYLSILQSWGLDIEPFGGNTFMLRATPSWFPQGEEKAIFYEILDWVRENGKVETAKLRDASAKMMACKAAIKANRHLRQDEMEALLEQMNQCENPFTCPHGRPIYIHFSKYDLEKMFKRVM